MKTQTKPLSEINSQAIRLLSEKLGVSDTFRFVNQFTIGHGNYTAERDAMFRDVTLDDIVSAIEKKQPTHKPLNRNGGRRGVK